MIEKQHFEINLNKDSGISNWWQAKGGKLQVLDIRH
jgi:hypothetical protein